MIVWTLKIELAAPILSQHIVVFFARKDGPPEQQKVKDNSRRKNVANWLAFGGHVLDVDDLGCDKAWSATSYEQVFAFVGISCESEITDSQFKAIFVLEHNVLRLEVTMNDALLVKVIKSHQNLLDDFSSLLGCEFSLIFNFVIQLLSLQIFEDDVNRVVGFINFL